MWQTISSPSTTTPFRRFPYQAPIELESRMLVSPDQVIEHLGPFIEDGRKSRIEDVVNNRTYRYGTARWCCEGVL